MNTQQSTYNIKLTLGGCEYRKQTDVKQQVPSLGLLIFQTKTNLFREFVAAGHELNTNRRLTQSRWGNIHTAQLIYKQTLSAKCTVNIESKSTHSAVKRLLLQHFPAGCDTLTLTCFCITRCLTGINIGLTLHSVQFDLDHVWKVLNL